MVKRCLNSSGRVRAIALMLSMALLLPALVPSAAFAGTLFTYNGTGICGKESVHSASISSSTCTVTHTQTREYGGSASMRVDMQKKEGLFWNSKASRSFYNDVVSQKFSSWLDSGTYRLYFTTVSGANKFTIRGSFSN